MKSRGPTRTGTLGFVFFFPFTLSLITLVLKERKGLQGLLQFPVSSHAGPCSSMIVSMSRRSHGLNICLAGFTSRADVWTMGLVGLGYYAQRSGYDPF